MLLPWTRCSARELSWTVHGTRTSAQPCTARLLPDTPPS